MQVGDQGLNVYAFRGIFADLLFKFFDSHILGLFLYLAGAFGLVKRESQEIGLEIEFKESSGLVGVRLIGGAVAQL